MAFNISSCLKGFEDSKCLARSSTLVGTKDLSRPRSAYQSILGSTEHHFKGPAHVAKIT